MERSKIIEAQIAFVLRQAEEGTRLEEACRKAGIGQAKFYNWKKKYGGLMPSEMKRLKQLEEENGRLKRIVAGPKMSFASKSGKPPRPGSAAATGASASTSRSSARARR